MNTIINTGNNLKSLIWCSYIILLLTACNKTESFKTAEIKDYAPLQTGKYITYQLDSLVYLAFGTRDTTISYQVKYLTDSLITDNNGRPAYRIFRFIRKNNATNWMPDATFLAINTGNSLEFIENNMRFIKLKQPIQDGQSWKGNAFIDTYSSNSLIRYMDNWDYTYSNVAGAENLGNLSFNNTITVNQRDEVIGIPEDPFSYSEINFAKEIYAEGIGMVYKKFFHNEYQPGNGGYAAEGSYGITLTIIDHN